MHAYESYEREGARITVYFEYVILNNLIINSLLIWFVLRTIKRSAPKFRIFLASLVGTVCAIILPLLSYTGLASFVIKLFVGAMVVFVVENRSFARFLLFYLLFLTYTFAFGGAIYGFSYMFVESANAFTLFDATSIPIWMFVSFALIFAKIMSLLIRFLNVRHSINNYLRDVVIYYNDEKFKITSYLDTGNRLIDPISRAPVIIITISLFLKMFPDVSIDRVFLNKLAESDIDDGHYIKFSTVDSANGNMFVFAPQKIDVVENRSIKSHDNVRLGVALKGFKDAIKYDALLNASLA